MSRTAKADAARREYSRRQATERCAAGTHDRKAANAEVGIRQARFEQHLREGRRHRYLERRREGRLGVGHDHGQQYGISETRARGPYSSAG